MNEAKLKACPFCGSKRIGTTERNTDMNLSLKGILCADCGGGIETIHNHCEQAASAWNKRAGDREPEADPSAGDIASSSAARLLAAFDDALNQNPFLWIEIGYTRPADWMVHVWDRTRKTDEGKIITTQSPSRTVACLEAANRLSDYLTRGSS